MSPMNDEHAPQPPRDEAPGTPVTPGPGASTPAAPGPPGPGPAGSTPVAAPYPAEPRPGPAPSWYDQPPSSTGERPRGSEGAFWGAGAFGTAAPLGSPSAETTEPLPATVAPHDAVPPAAAAPAGAGTAAPRRGPGWGGTSALVLAGMLLSSGLTLGGVVAYDQLQEDEPVAAAQESQTAEARPAATTTAEDPDWAVIAEQVSPSAVSILASTGSGTSQGTGVVLAEDGTILTNDHVAGDAQSLQVTTSDGRSYAASVVGTDPTTDLAVIRLDSPPDDLQPATFADSSTVVVGQPVMALGTPLGLENTVTTGIVSALDRPVTASGEETDGSDTTYTSAIQTDAAINPGNSGGPLVDSDGRVVGINSAIATAGPGGGSIGVGFSIPINQARRIADQLRGGGKATHAVLGVTVGNDPQLRGAVIQEVTPDGAAAKAGLRLQEIVARLGDQRITTGTDLQAAVRSQPPGSVVQLDVVDAGGATRTVEVTLGEQ